MFRNKSGGECELIYHSRLEHLTAHSYLVQCENGIAKIRLINCLSLTNKSIGVGLMTIYLLTVLKIAQMHFIPEIKPPKKICLCQKMQLSMSVMYSFTLEAYWNDQRYM